MCPTDTRQLPIPHDVIGYLTVSSRLGLLPLEPQVLLVLVNDEEVFGSFAKGLDASRFLRRQA